MTAAGDARLYCGRTLLPATPDCRLFHAFVGPAPVGFLDVIVDKIESGGSFEHVVDLGNQLLG